MKWFMPKIPLVDDNDQLLRYIEKKAIAPGDIYRVSALWVQNSNGESLLARRAESKKLSPGKWGPAVAGTVEEGETYESNIIKEAKEEIGISGMTFVIGPKTRTDVAGEGSWFAQWFTVNLNKKADDFTIEPKEVAEVRWWKTQELKQEVMQHPERFVPNMKRYVESFCK